MSIFATATRLSDTPRWRTSLFAAPRLLSIGIHIMLVGLALVPWTSAPFPRPKVNETTILLYTPSNLVLTLPKDAGKSGGGGGGGRHQLTPASLGRLPRPADKQLVPPDPEAPKNPNPQLIVEQTIVAPQLNLPQLTLLNIGDPNGVVGPPSSGRGDGNGIGPGNGHGVGPGDGPGAGPGKDGGSGDGPFQIGGNVSAPTVVFRVEPEYSEEARKARYEGTVLLEAVIKRDGRVDVVHLLRSLGFGLDQNAIQALKQWRFRPATQNGKAVYSILNVEVRFNLR
jgi:protein TonB